MSAIRHLWAHHRAALLLFLAACAATLFFLIRLTVFTLYWADPAHRELAPEAWMTPGYVAHSWGLDPQELARALGAPAGQRLTLDQIARQRGIPIEALLAEISQHLEKAGE